MVFGPKRRPNRRHKPSNCGPNFDSSKQSAWGSFAIVLFCVLVAFVVVVGFLRLPWVRGAIGEVRVNRSLRAALGDDYQLFHDLMLPLRDSTTQVDQVIVSPFGIFVVETKNMSGWIFGSADQAQWTQVIFRRKSKFQNPLRQNFQHVKAVQSLLGISAHKVHGIVAFVGNASPRSATPAGVVWSIQSLAQQIRSRRLVVLSDEEVRTIAARLSNDDLRSTFRTRSAHVRRIKAQVARRRDPSNCPRCGTTLVERTNRRDGSRFLACPRYPDCKGTRNLY